MVRCPAAVQGAFVVVCAICVLVPSLGMLWAPTQESTENRELAPKPELVQDGSLNVNYLADCGTYFEDHFAYRNNLVAANARIRSTVLGVSSSDSVVVGTNGWLYYAGTIPDYTGSALLSDRAARNIAFNLSLMQGYCEAQGASFTFTIPANKSELYPEQMPYYYTQASSSNFDVLEPYLKEYGINYLDVQSLLANEEDVMYYQRDSHWNTKGALMACEAYMTSVGDPLLGLEGIEGQWVASHEGDLDGMLYATGATLEGDYSYDDSLLWEYVEGSDVMDGWINTRSTASAEQRHGKTLFAYRDSFAINMIPFLATVYENAYFSKMVPYDLTQVGAYNADRVLVERAQRHMRDLSSSPAIMPAPMVELDSGVERLEEALPNGIEVAEDGPYYVVSGEIPPEYEGKSEQLFVGLSKSDGLSWVVPFCISSDMSDYGYKAYIDKGFLNDVTDIVVACESDGKLVCVQKTNKVW
ncbi:hypothetical protein [Adlercreutzia sp. ZJ138]|uniref:alginate O-acetyltransferase AlgX-related protein n=1 Tax=Adlercreutzia sp. ZJ138 TaxID=2709405 RepID=UPI0013ECD84B|nr:hypothetical protein [Adlercreutzia sp. ZJ138]